MFLFSFLVHKLCSVKKLDRDPFILFLVQLGNCRKCRFYLKAAKADAGVDKKAKYLAVLALSDHEHLSYWPSTVAAALVILALLESHQDTSYHRVIEVKILTQKIQKEKNKKRH